MYKTLTDEQRSFLTKITELHYSITCTFTHRWPYLVEDVLRIGKYHDDDSDARNLNEVAQTYKAWKEERHHQTTK